MTNPITTIIASDSNHFFKELGWLSYLTLPILWPQMTINFLADHYAWSNEASIVIGTCTIFAYAWLLGVILI